MGILVVCPGRNGQMCRGWRCRRRRTLVHKLPQTVVVLDDIVEPLLDLLGIPEEGFALCERLVLLLRAVEEGFEPPEPEFEREFRADRRGSLQRRRLLRWHKLFGGRRVWAGGGRRR